MKKESIPLQSIVIRVECIDYVWIDCKLGLDASIQTRHNHSCLDDETELKEALNRWITHIEEKRPFLKLFDHGEEFLILASRSIEEALEFFYGRAFEGKLLRMANAPQNHNSRCTSDPNAQTHACQNGKQIHPVRLLVCQTLLLEELREILGRQANHYPGYAESGCECLTADDLERLKEYVGHAAIITDGETNANQ